MVVEMILSANTSSKSAINICPVWAIVPSCWEKDLSISSSFICVMKEYTILSQYRWEFTDSEKNLGPTMRLRDIPTQTPIFLSSSGESCNAWGFYAHQTREFWLLMYPDQRKYASYVNNVTSKMSSLSRSRKSINHLQYLQYTTRLALSPGFNSSPAVIL
jgi:hypothetical protein